MSHSEINGERVDESRWITSPACSQHDLLLGNSHTFRGRMYVYCPHDEEGYSISLSEIDEMSLESRQWIDGYLAGSEPSGEEIFGADFAEFADDDPRVGQWRQAVHQYRRTGEWRSA